VKESDRISFEDDNGNTIDPRTLTKKQIAQLMKEAAQNASSDGKRDKMIEAYNKWIKPRRDNQE
jgi:hypothetical protein